jgi:putative ABC transport system permease protein
MTDEDYRYISLTVNTGRLRETLAFIEGVYRKLFPDKLYDYFFLDTDFDRQYRAEEQIARLFSGFTFLGLFIACLGLFGMASFIAEQRTKEIGIRKVMGASVTTIVVMLSKDFTKWVLAANIIAWPLGYIAMHRWLQDFAYRTEPGLWIFLLAGITTAAIALITVSVQAVRAAIANPVNSLRYE